LIIVGITLFNLFPYSKVTLKNENDNQQPLLAAERELKSKKSSLNKSNENNKKVSYYKDSLINKSATLLFNDKNNV